jgi:hypothetical protein
MTRSYFAIRYSLFAIRHSPLAIRPSISRWHRQRRRASCRLLLRHAAQRCLRSHPLRQRAGRHYAGKLLRSHRRETAHGWHAARHRGPSSGPARRLVERQAGIALLALCNSALRLLGEYCLRNAVAACIGIGRPAGLSLGWSSRPFALAGVGRHARIWCHHAASLFAIAVAIGLTAIVCQSCWAPVIIRHVQITLSSWRPNMRRNLGIHIPRASCANNCSSDQRICII